MNIKYWFFPRRCNVCGDVVLISDSICEKCRDNIAIAGEICYSCGKSKLDCTCKKSRHKPSYNAIVAPYKYDGNVANAIYRLKFYGREELAYPMGKQIASTVKEHFGDVSFDFVTSVPTTKYRSFKRGYNQSLLLAKVVARELNLPYKTSLRKVFNTPPQRKVKAKFRRGNVFGAYDIKPNVDIENKTILIIDDVKTTGATISHCSYLLKIYGAKSVYASTFAIR